MYKHLIVFPIVSAIALILHSLNTSKHNEDLIQSKLDIELQKINLILHDYNNVILYPVNYIQEIFGEYFDLLEFIGASFKNFEVTLIHEEYIEVVNMMSLLVQDIKETIILTNDEIDKLKINEKIINSYDLFNSISIKIDKFSAFIPKVSDRTIELENSLNLVISKISEIEWSSTIVVENIEQDQKMIKPLNVVFSNATDIFSKIIDGFKTLFHQRSIFCQRMEYITKFMDFCKNSLV